MGIDRTESKKSGDEAKRELRRQAARESEETALLTTIVLEQVKKGLGEVPNLLQLVIRPLWKNHYRANVYVGNDFSSARIFESFFIVTDEAGTIKESTPRISSVRKVPA
jgi:hypothetical protein